MDEAAAAGVLPSSTRYWAFVARFLPSTQVTCTRYQPGVTASNDQRPTFSPVPTQTVCGSLGSSVTTPVAYDPSFSNTASQVMPLFVVLNTLPDDTAT